MHVQLQAYFNGKPALFRYFAMKFIMRLPANS